MAGEKYSDLVSHALDSYFTTNLRTYLTAVETAQDLTEGSLTPPDSYIEGDLADNQSIQFQTVVGNGGEELEKTVHAYEAFVAIHYMGDADFEAAELRGRRYLTALVDCLYADRTLGGAVAVARMVEEINEHEKTSDLQSAHAIGLRLNVITG